MFFFYPLPPNFRSLLIHTTRVKTAHRSDQDMLVSFIPADSSIPDWRKWKLLKMLYKCIMANTSATWQQAAHTTYQRSSPSCSTRATIKNKTKKVLTKKFESFLEKNPENGPHANLSSFKKIKNDWDRKSKRTKQRNKTGDRKGESNDSPEVPDSESNDSPEVPDRELNDSPEIPGKG